MKNLKLLTLFTAVVLLITSCRVTEPLPIVDNSFSIVDGDTIKTRIETDFAKIKEHDPNGKRYISVGDTIVTYKEPKLHTPPTKDPDLSKIKNNDDPDLKGKPLRYVAIGGSLTAGVRDGGYFNEGILTSYPNLIARQMKLKKFEQPLFDNADYNGFGRKARTNFNPTGGPVPKFKDVENNTGVESTEFSIVGYGQEAQNVENVKLKKYKNYKNVDNWSAPNLSIGGFSPYYRMDAYDRDNKNKSNRELMARIAQENDKSFGKHILGQNFDFFTYEIGWNEIFEWISNKASGSPGIYWGLSNADEILRNKSANEIDLDIYNLNPQIMFVKRLSEKKVKGVFLTVPDISKLPYFTQFIKQNVKYQIVTKYSSDLLFYTSSSYHSLDELFLLPNSEVDSLLSDKVHPALKKGISKDRPLSADALTFLPSITYAKQIVNAYNEQNKAFGRYCNAPVGDIYALYEKILVGGFVTDDGVRVDASFPNGNFFSSDGIYPTAFGQAVIANEVIKAINDYYKMKIPLIPTREYLEK